MILFFKLINEGKRDFVTLAIKIRLMKKSPEIILA